MNLSERNRRIVLRVQDGETLEAIGASYGITRERVRQIAAKRGVRSVHWIDKVDYTHRDVGTILDRLDRGMPHAHIAEVANCRPHTVARIAQRYRGYEPARDDRTWTAKETEFLTKRYKTPGWSAAKIAVKLGRTRDGVIGRANRLGLCRPPPKPTKTVAGRVRIALQRNPALSNQRLAAMIGCSREHAKVARWRVTNEDRHRNWARQRWAERVAA